LFIKFISELSGDSLLNHLQAANVRHHFLYSVFYVFVPDLSTPCDFVYFRVYKVC